MGKKSGDSRIFITFLVLLRAAGPQRRRTVSEVCVGGLCRRSVSKVSVYATYATYARHRGTLADFIFFLN